MESLQVILLDHDDRWQLPEADVLRALEATAAVLQRDFTDQDVNIALSNDEEVHALNKQFRGHDKPTNVLSFPSDEPNSLGDIILAYETVMSEDPCPAHTLHLIIHGFLHLLGYDHENDDEAEVMETLEIKILARLGLPNPYEET